MVGRRLEVLGRLDEPKEERRSGTGRGTTDAPGLHEGVVPRAAVLRVAGELDAVRAHRLAGDHELDVDASGGSHSLEVSHELAGLVAVGRGRRQPCVIPGLPQVLFLVGTAIEILVCSRLLVGAEVHRVGDPVIVAVRTAVERDLDLVDQGVCHEDASCVGEPVVGASHVEAPVHGIHDGVAVGVEGGDAVRPRGRRISVRNQDELASRNGGPRVPGVHYAVAVVVGELGEDAHSLERTDEAVVELLDRRVVLEAGDRLLDVRVLGLERFEPGRDRRAVLIDVLLENADRLYHRELVGGVLELHPDAGDGDRRDHELEDDEEPHLDVGARRLRVRSAAGGEATADGIVEADAHGEEVEADADADAEQDEDHPLPDVLRMDEVEEVGHGVSMVTLEDLSRVGVNELIQRSGGTKTAKHERGKISVFSLKVNSRIQKINNQC